MLQTQFTMRYAPPNLTSIYARKPDALKKPAIFTIMDITTDGFGYMLVAGDLLWVPFTYSLQARYLAFEHVELGGVGTGIVVLVAFTGYWIFRSANGEKNDFRNGRNPKSRFFNGIVCAILIRLSQISLIWTQSEEPSF